MANYHVGDPFRQTAVFYDFDGSTADPTAVVFHLRDPSGNVAEYTSGTDPELIKSAPATHQFTLPSLDEAGRWDYKWVATGNIAQREPGAFIVRTEVIP